MTSGSSGRPELLTPRARALLPVFLVVLVALAVRQLYCAVPDRIGLRGQTMGTTWLAVLRTEGRSRGDADAARSAIEARLEQVNRLMSTWDPDSELSRFNRHATTEPFPMSPETLEVLRIAQDVAEQSGGALDVTVAPLVAAWGFGAGARLPGHGPEGEELEDLRARVGWRLLELGETWARKLRPDVQCDLSAIAKGFAVDEAARALSELGWTAFLVEVGGEVRALGERPGGGPWRVGIERPVDEGQVMHGVITLRGTAMATSGDYRNFYEQDGKRLSHIVDPRTGRPVEHQLASVSVLHRQTAIADAWATALAVLGPEEGFARAQERGIAAYFVTRQGDGSFRVQATSPFPAVSSASADPTG
jgi:thiamine biosynthesis lipoprotein